MILVYILAAIGLFAFAKWLFAALRPKEAAPAATAPIPAAAEKPDAQDDEELLAAVMAAAMLLCTEHERIRRITPLSYDEPKKPLLRASYTIEEIR